MPLDKKCLEVTVNCESFMNMVGLYQIAFLYILHVGGDSLKR